MFGKMLTDQVVMVIEGDEVNDGVGNVGELMLDVVAGSGYISNAVQVPTKLMFLSRFKKLTLLSLFACILMKSPWIL